MEEYEPGTIFQNLPEPFSEFQQLAAVETCQISLQILLEVLFIFEMINV